jgi:putative thioredoxin
MTDVTDDTFEADVLVRSETVPVVVDLWAPWCGPCRTLGPILESVIGGTDGKVELVKINVDENPRVSATFQVQSIPAVFALSDRKVVNQFIGAIPQNAVQEFVDDLLSANG